MEQNSRTKLRLDVFYKTEDKQYVFLRRLALTFRIKLPLLAELLQLPEKDISQLLERHNPNYNRALKYLFVFDISDQNEARIKVLAYYQELLNAKIAKDKDKQERLIRQIADSDLTDIFNKSKTGKRLNLDEYKKVLIYHLKNAISLRSIVSMLGVDKNTYLRNIKPLLEENDDLRLHYERLAEFNVMSLDSYRKYISRGER